MNDSPGDRASVLVSHRLPLVAAGVAAALAECDRFDVTSGHAALAWSRTCPPPGTFRVAVTDHERALQWLAEARAAQGARPAAAALRILVVSASDRESDVCAAVRAGVHGYVLMDCETHELLDGVRLVSNGARYLCAGVAHRMAESLTHEALTQRETDVLTLMVEGLGNKLIALRLGIALGTVKAHAKAVFAKLDVATRTQAVSIAAQRGLLQRAPAPVAARRRPAFGAPPTAAAHPDGATASAAEPGLPPGARPAARLPVASVAQRHSQSAGQAA